LGKKKKKRKKENLALRFKHFDFLVDCCAQRDTERERERERQRERDRRCTEAAGFIS
jgi:hypothetical protein